MKALIKTLLGRNDAGLKLLELRRELLLARSALRRANGNPSSLGQPFNGQEVRLRTVRMIMDNFRPDAVVETGTFVGSTTRFFSGNLVPVYSVEVKFLFYLVAKLFLGLLPDIKLVRGNSPVVLKELAAKREFSRPLAYLDAHWWAGLPLQEEVTQLLEGWAECIILIDDFQVPGDPGYGFDTYQGVPLSLELLTLPASAIMAFPASQSEFETGSRRGSLYIAQGDDATATLHALANMGLLAISTHRHGGVLGVPSPGVAFQGRQSSVSS